MSRTFERNKTVDVFG